MPALGPVVLPGEEEQRRWKSGVQLLERVLWLRVLLLGRMGDEARLLHVDGPLQCIGDGFGWENCVDGCGKRWTDGNG